MAGERFEVTFSGLRTATARFKVAGGDVREALGTFQATTEAAASAVGRQAAAEAVLAFAARWMLQLGRLQLQLEDLGSAVELSAELYEVSDQGLARSFGTGVDAR